MLKNVSCYAEYKYQINTKCGYCLVSNHHILSKILESGTKNVMFIVGHKESKIIRVDWINKISLLLLCRIGYTNVFQFHSQSKYFFKI